MPGAETWMFCSEIFLQVSRNMGKNPATLPCIAKAWGVGEGGYHICVCVCGGGGGGLYGHFTPVFHHYRPQTKFAKVMFLHLSVSHSVHRRGCLGPCPRAGGLPRRGPGPGPGPGPGGGGCPGPGPAAVCIPACTEADIPPRQTANAADGTHPTGMHSYFITITVFMSLTFLTLR